MTAAPALLLQTTFLSLALLWDFSSTAPAQLFPSEAEDEECPHATKYYLTEYRLCCSRCPPGYYANETCTPGRDTTCLRCPDNSFIETWNFLSRCQRCPYCDPGLGFEVALPCNLTHMTKCRCMEGTHCKTVDTPEKCDHCEDHSKCKPGTEVFIPGNSTSDTVCTPCQSGFYQDVSSLLAVCQPHNNCTALGLQFDTPGSATHGSRCVPTPREVSDYSTLLVSLGILAGLLSITIVSITSIICFRRVALCRKLKNSKNEKQQLAEKTLTDPSSPNSPKDPLLPGSQNPSELLRRSLNFPIQEKEKLQSNTSLQRKVSQPEPHGHVDDMPERAPEDLGSVRDWQGQHVTVACNSGFQLNGCSMTFNGNVYSGAGATIPSFPADSPFGFPQTAVCMPGAGELRLVSPQQEHGKEVHMSVEENRRGVTPFPIL